MLLNLGKTIYWFAFGLQSVYIIRSQIYYAFIYVYVLPTKAVVTQTNPNHSIDFAINQYKHIKSKGNGL